MDSINIIAAAVCAICVLIVVLFWLDYKKSLRKFFEIENNLHKKIVQHTSQIRKRLDGVNQYNLLKYNLSACLVVQDEIIL